MRLRPCIDIHNGRVKQIVGGSLTDEGDRARENFISFYDADHFAKLYESKGLNGGHIILLNPATSPYYNETKRQGVLALSAARGLMQIGGGINDENAPDFLDAGASHVIVTSFVFRDGAVNMENLEKLVRAVGKERIVLDLSCKKAGNDYYVVTDRWQKMTDVRLSLETMDELSDYCDEFLVHAADVEGQQRGIEEGVADILSGFGKRPVTYAGGIRNVSDIKELRRLGQGRIDVTVGSSLDIFGGNLSLDDAIAACN